MMGACFISEFYISHIDTLVFTRHIKKYITRKLINTRSDKNEILHSCRLVNLTGKSTTKYYYRSRDFGWLLVYFRIL